VSLARAKAREIITTLNIDRPELLLHLDEICWERGAFVREVPLTNAEARILMRGDKGIISYRRDLKYPARNRFSIAHELGHFELHRDVINEIQCDSAAMTDWFGRQKVAQREMAANEFAVELLLPEVLLQKEIANQKPSMALIKSVAKRYFTSLTPTAKRFVEITAEACAVVMYDSEKILFSWKSPLFDKQGYWIHGGKLDSYTYAHDATKNKPTPDYMSEVDVTAWLDVPDYLKETTVKEGTHFSPGINRGFSLLWIHNPRLIIR
jgi:IrrE N-terminal-like domain